MFVYFKSPALIPGLQIQGVACFIPQTFLLRRIRTLWQPSSHRHPPNHHVCAITPPETSLSPTSVLQSIEFRKRVQTHQGPTRNIETPLPNRFQHLLRPQTGESVSEIPARTASTVNSSTVGTDKVNRLLLIDTMAKHFEETL